MRAAIGPGDGPRGGRGATCWRASPSSPGARWPPSPPTTQRRRRAGSRHSPRASTRCRSWSTPSEALREQRLADDPAESERGDPEAGFARADVVIEAEYRTPAQVQMALEPNCAVAHWHSEGDLEVWISTQGIHDARRELARAFGLEAERVVVRCEFMGGGFGAKQGTTIEGYLAVELARRAGRPVRLVNDRRAQTVATGHRAATHQTYRIGAMRDGTLTAIDATAAVATGAWGWTFPVTNPAMSLYRCADAREQKLPLKLELGFSNAFRAPGVMEGTWGFEQALDELAQTLSLDPIELRLRNSVDFDQISGNPYSSKHLDACFRRAAELAGWDRREGLRRDPSPDGLRRGMGVAGQIWWGSGGPPAQALVRIGEDARATVVTGSQDIGTGVTTTFAQVAAEVLGLPIEQVRVEIGSTATGQYAPVSGGSMTTPAVAPAVHAAAAEVRDKLLALASDLFEVAPGDLILRGGEVRSRDGALHRPISEVTEKLGRATLVGTGSRGPNPENVRIQTFGCQIAQVAVDEATGEIRAERVVAVHDVGRIINPLAATSQVEGGVLQALGFALGEERVVDPTTGTVVNAGFEDYVVPTMSDCPEIVVEFIDEPDPQASSVGSRGLGEPPIVPTAAAVANAVAHATGVRMREAPMTRRRFLEART